MVVELYTMAEFKDLITSLCEPLMDYYVREDPVRICAGGYILSADGKIKQMANFNKISKKLRKELSWFEEQGSSDSRYRDLNNGMRHLTRLLRLGSPYSFRKVNDKSVWAGYDPNYDVVILDLGNLAKVYIASVTNGLIDQEVTRLELTLAHELVHRDIEKTKFCQKNKQYANIHNKSCSIQQICSSTGGYKIESKNNGRQQLSLDQAKEWLLAGKIKGTELEELSKEDLNQLRFICFHDENHYLVLNESLAYAVQETLFPGINPPDFERNFPESVEFQKLFENTYYKLRNQIKNPSLIKPTIHETIQVMNQAYNKEKSPLEFMGLI